MRGFATSPNPYTSGLRPRRFLAETAAIIKREIMMGKNVRKAAIKKAA